MMWSVLSLLLLPSAIATSGWGYREGDPEVPGPSSWGGECNLPSSLAQSPVNINTDAVSDEGDDDLLRLTGYGGPDGGETDVAAVLVNNGHTAKLTPEYMPANSAPMVSGGGLPGTFRFAQVHFHWGNKSDRGSEHKINGRSSALEAHLVHFNVKYGDTLGDALRNSSGAADALAVLGFLFDVSGQFRNPALEAVTAQLPEVVQAGSRIKLSAAPALPPAGMVGSDPVKNVVFFRYKGSLTTPNCNQVVTWILFQTPQKIGKSQLASFRTLLDANNGTLVDNFRPVQPLNGRTIVRRMGVVVRDGKDSENSGTGGGGGKMVKSINFILIASFIIRSIG